jgi:hypothetical protein
MIWFILPIAICILIVALAVKLIRKERGERGDEGPGDWNRWRGPRDWPKLPPTPKGSGPTPDYVPDEWVWEEFGKPPRLIPVLPPKDEV